jgi:hypothetical protein
VDGRGRSIGGRSMDHNLGLRDLGWRWWRLDNSRRAQVGDDATIITSSEGRTRDYHGTGVDVGSTDFFGVWASCPRWVMTSEGDTTLVSPPNALE